ncbi:MAG: preprotein translocase subunit SecG [Deltaproteobacteria bacterium]|nr:MAG: preprotein translocase subunit SecG [Deltaproteobacteria bacterium]
MSGLILGIHILACLLLIVVVLVQTGKGAEIGAVFGGGASSTIFGSAGPAGFLTKVTTVVAIVFMLTSLLLTVFTSKPVTKTVVDQPPRQEAPMPQKK